MKAFLQKFALIVAGVLQGFDRVVFKGKLTQLYRGEGMHCLLRANHIRREQFKIFAAATTKKILAESLVAKAKELDRFRYLNSSRTDKEQLARQIAHEHDVREGLVCVLQCVEPCWTFDLAKSPAGVPFICGEWGKCSHLYHYYIHPLFGWMYVRLQTWFPFEFQIGINGREWLARQMDQEKLKYTRSDNKIRVNNNSLKMYNHANVLRVEMTINKPEEIKAFRRSNSVLRPHWSYMWRNLRRSVADMPHRVVVGEKANDRYLEALATLVETRTVREVAEPLTRRAAEPPGKKTQVSPRFVRGLNPLKAEDAKLLAVISDPKWMIQGLRNRDLVAALYGEPATDDKERRRRSSRVTRLIRLLRSHDLLTKIAKTHRYQILPEARTKIQGLLALHNANAEQLTSNAA